MTHTEYGHFDDANREYVITNPKTPFPWINYLGNEDFFGLISNTAGGYNFYKDAKFRRITRYRYNSVPMDSAGRYFYVKDGETIWNPGWKPCKTELDSYECRHGLNYTRITGEKNQVRASVLFFVPLGVKAEIQRVTISNLSNEIKHLKLFSYAEWCLWNAATDGENFQRNLSTGEVEIERDAKFTALYHKTEYKERRDHYAYYALTNAKADGYDTDREKWWNYVTESGMQGLQFCEMKKMKESLTAQAFGIKWIPSMIVLNTEGKVLLATVQIEKLGERLKHLDYSRVKIPRSRRA